MPDTPLRPMLDFLVEKWIEMHTLGEYISVDEGILKWRDGLHFRVYINDKSTKHGDESFNLADSETGYCWNLDI